MKIVSAIALLAFANNFQIGIAEELGCADDEFRCADGSKCIGYRYFCDSRVECDDGSDEILYNDTIHTDEDGIKCQDRFRDRYCLLDKQYDPDRFCFIQENCIPAEFRCASGTQCVLYESICDGHPSCRDGSDEVLYDPEIHTADDGIPCRGWSNLTRECLLPAKFAELEDNICNKDAECMCSFFKCSDGSKCVTKEDFCDGYPHCDDGSDEIRYDPEIHSEEDGLPCYLGEWDLPACLLPSKFKQNSDCLCDKISWCPHDQYMCPDSRECISKERFCDGKEDCGDGSDEVQFEPIVDDPNIPSDGSDPIFECTSWLDFNRTCLLKMNYMPEYICNTEKKCSPGFFRCSNGHQCVHKSQFCDGTNDCEDDEILYDPSNHTVGDGTPCRGWKDLSRICLLKPGINSSGLCNTDLECSTGYFRCSDGSACIPKTKFCDRVKDCEDGSDEIRYKRKHKGVHVGHKCRGWRNLRDKCLLDYSQDKRSICNPVKDCAPGFMKCANGFECFSKDQFCDGKEHCKNDGIDEIEFDPSIHTSSDGLKCTTSHGRTCLLSAAYVPAFEEVCKIVECGEEEFRCGDGYSCIPLEQFCDGQWDCFDGSDETAYDSYLHGTKEGVKCQPKSQHRSCLLPKGYNTKELCFSPYADCQPDEFRCADGMQCISKYAMCNGNVDCRDGSDEREWDDNTGIQGDALPCRTWDDSHTICVIPREFEEFRATVCNTNATCRTFKCSDGSKCVGKEEFCDGYSDCDDGSDEIKYDPLVHTEKDGWPCFLFEWEHPACLLPVTHNPDPDLVCDRIGYCAEDEFMCADSRKCISKEKFCDYDLSDCEDQSDEVLFDPDSQKPSEGHICPSWKDPYHVCLLPIGYDPEMICNLEQECPSGHFRCRGDQQCRSVIEFCDGIQNCEDDEIEYNATEHSPDDGVPCRGWLDLTNICLLSHEQNSSEICNTEMKCFGNDYFLCADKSACIPTSDFCDGKQDCGDGSDEVPYDYASEGSIPCYSCQLRAEEAHKAEEICHRVTECAEDAFLCSDRSMCLHKHKFCDGKKDCRDGSDEERYKGTKNRLGEACRSWKNIRHQCLLTYASGQDVEKICNPVIGCGTGFYKCLNQVQCIPIDQFCDGNENCRRNASDEMPIELFANTKIKGKSCLRNKRVCLFPSTADQTLFGEVCEDVTCGPDEFMCADGTQCVNKRLLCDQKRDCLDGTDEMVYNASEGIPGRQCNSWVYPNNECLLPETPFNTGKYNATALCNDDRECDGFLCTNGSKCISSSDFCQGENDCPDGSDEVVYNASIHTPRDGTSCKGQYYVVPCLLNPMNYGKRDIICED